MKTNIFLLVFFAALSTTALPMYQSKKFPADSNSRIRTLKEMRKSNPGLYWDSLFNENYYQRLYRHFKDRLNYKYDNREEISRKKRTNGVLKTLFGTGLAGFGFSCLHNIKKGVNAPLGSFDAAMFHQGFWGKLIGSHNYPFSNPKYYGLRGTLIAGTLFGFSKIYNGTKQYLKNFTPECFVAFNVLEAEMTLYDFKGIIRKN